jgi:hypothetical protein
LQALQASVQIRGIGVFHLGWQEAGGDYVVTAAFEDYLRQWLGGRAVEDCAVGGGEYAAVAGAGEEVGLGAVEDWAGVMGAEAAEGDVGFFGGAEEKAGAVVGGIGENFAASYGDFVGLGDYFSRVPGFAFLPVGCKRADDGQGASDAEPFVEASAGHLRSLFSAQALVIGFVNGWLPSFCGAAEEDKRNPSLRSE